MATVSPDWASLQEDILHSIMGRLFQFSDHVQFSMVCKSWFSLAVSQNQCRMKECDKQVPLLLIPTKDRSHERRGLYNITRNKIYNLQLSMPYDRRCCGSSHGWLATVEENLGVTLINPFSSKTIHFPPVDDRLDAAKGYNKRYPFKYQYYVRKLILSANPSLMPKDFVVVAIYSPFKHLAFIKPGDKSWTYIQKDCAHSLSEDVIFYKGKIYTVEHYKGKARILSVDISVNSPQLKIVALRAPYNAFEEYIVESSGGDLLLVLRHATGKDDDFQWMTSKFQVFKLLGGKEGLPCQWVEMETLGDDALFLGDNHSQSVLASNFSGCQPNCIYYTDDYIESLPYFPLGPFDMGIYNLEDRSIGPHYQLKPRLKRMPPAIWIVPTLQ